MSNVTLTDSNGTVMPREEVENLVYHWMMDNETKEDVVNKCVKDMDVDELTQWATDDDGNFISIKEN